MYLITASKTESTLTNEINNIESWCKRNNLNLNKKKSQEVIFHSNKKNATIVQNLPTIPDIPRVSKIKILGITIENDFSMASHVNNVVAKAAQSMYAVKVLKAHGLRSIDLVSVTTSLVLSHLLYAIPAWWGYCKANERAKLQSIINKCYKWDFFGKTNNPKNIQDIVHEREKQLFQKILNNPDHTLHKFLPPIKSLQYNLRPQAHNRLLPIKQSSQMTNNFITRLLYGSL